jgi:hypothetical protein
MRLLGGSSTTREFTQCIKLWVEQWYPSERDALTEAVGEVFAEHDP